LRDLAGPQTSRDGDSGPRASLLSKNGDSMRVDRRMAAAAEDRDRRPIPKSQRQNNGGATPSILAQPTQCLTNLAEVNSQALNALTTPGFEAMVRISPSLSRSIAPSRVVLTQSPNRVPPDYEPAASGSPGVLLGPKVTFSTCFWLLRESCYCPNLTHA